MITKFLTEVTAKFNPFSPQSLAVRLFLTNLPSNARQTGMVISTTLLPRASSQNSYLGVKYKDGKHLEFNGDKMTIKTLTEEVDRHSRALLKKEALSD